jgi:hypothetical protein
MCNCKKYVRKFDVWVYDPCLHGAPKYHSTFIPLVPLAIPIHLLHCTRSWCGEQHFEPNDMQLTSGEEVYRGENFTALSMKLVWDLMLCHGVSCFWQFEGIFSTIFKGQPIWDPKREGTNSLRIVRHCSPSNTKSHHGRHTSPFLTLWVP